MYYLKIRTLFISLIIFISMVFLNYIQLIKADNSIIINENEELEKDELLENKIVENGKEVS